MPVDHHRLWRWQQRWWYDNTRGHYTAGSVLLSHDGQTLDGTVSFDGANNIIQFTPSSLLALLGSYTATLTTAITDLTGNALSVDHVWNFSVRDGIWSTATSIETGPGDADSPNIPMDDHGNGLAVWHQEDGSRKDIWANRYVNGSGWGTLCRLPTILSIVTIHQSHWMPAVMP